MMRHDIYSLSRGKLLSFTFRKLKRTRSTCAYYPNCCATRQILLLGGDISTNPGPNIKRKPKCEQCERTMAKNSRSIQCVECECIKHLKCAGLTAKSSDRLETGWKCTKYSLKELPLFDAPISPGVNEIPDNTHDAESKIDQDESYVHTLQPTVCSSIVDERKADSRELMIAHLNINSLQNKFDDLQILNDSLKAHILVVSETKTDRTYPDSQFFMEGYKMYRKDRIKGGGGVIAYLDTCIPSTKIALPKSYKTLEAIAIEISKTREIIVLAVYRSPKMETNKNTDNHKYMDLMELEMNDIVMWAGLQKQSVVLAGDLNMDRLKPTERLGKILVDLEEVNVLQCMILEPTRITPTTSTLLDVILTNQPDLYRNCGVHHLALSDHSMVYGIMRDKVCKHQPKIIIYGSTKNIDNALLNQDLITAP